MAKKERTRVLRLDGKPINLVRKRCHVMVCAKGCCCGRTDRNYPAVPIEFYKQEYKRRKLRNRIQLSMNGCLGPCTLANVVLVFFDGQPIWFQSVNSEAQIAAIYDYIEKMLAAERYLPPPAELTEYVFNYYTWSNPLEALRPSATACGSAPGILFLTHADTDLLALHHARGSLPAEAPPIHAVSLNRIASPEHMLALLAEHGPRARVIVARLLGGVQSVPGFRRLVELARDPTRHFLVLSGAGEPDPELAALSTVPPAIARQAAGYLQMGGLANMSQCLRFLSDQLLLTGLGYQPPVPQPAHGIYHPDMASPASLADWLSRRDPRRPTVGVLFYRSHWMSGNLAFIDALVREIERRGANVLPVFTNSLKDVEAYAESRHGREGEAPAEPFASAGSAGASPSRTGEPTRLPAAFQYFRVDDKPIIDALISTMSFAMGEVNPDGPTLGGWSVEALVELDVPVVQAICCGTTRWQWQASARGLNPLDTAMNVALPEFDGRIISVPISFKEPLANQAPGGPEAVYYRPDPERIALVVGLTLRLARLRRLPNRQKKVAFILTNAASKASRVGNAVGLDAPASLIHIFAAMRDAGYALADVPGDGDTLIHDLIDRCSYDETLLTESQLAQAVGQVPVEEYARWFAELPESQRRQMTDQWGPSPGSAYVHDGHFALAGLDFGNVFLALQPPRGYGMDPAAIYHRPDLPPPHHYYALYRWLRDVWRADAIVHVGKHGTLEWLPGKSVGLSADCFPDSFLADMPLVYPFILNDPGEGAQAKRRAHAVIIDHMTPPLTTADAYGELAELMQLVDEYYQVEMLDPVKMPLLQRQIWDLIQKANLQEDLKFLMKENHGDHVHDWDDALTADGTPIGLAQLRGREISHIVQDLDGYLCELAGAQIRDGLHILGQVPQGEQLIGTLQGPTRLPNLTVPSLRASVASFFRLDIDVLQKDRGGRLECLSCSRIRENAGMGNDNPHSHECGYGDLIRLADRPLVTNADVLEVIDELCQHLLTSLQKRHFETAAVSDVVNETFQILGHDCSQIAEVLTFVCNHLVSNLERTTDEITHLLAALDGRYVPAGPSGALMRHGPCAADGPEFLAVDPRALPSMASWQVGQQLAREVLERYLRDTGAYPETVGISIWGTSAMRTGGDDLAEVLALMVRPIWQKENRHIVGVEVIPLHELARPRIDVVVRISGFFRDAFPHLIKLLDDAVKLVSERDEPLDRNFLRKHYFADLAQTKAATPNVDPAELQRRARYRIFGSKPGCYGAGLLPLIDERNWHDDADLAETYVNWGGYAYSGDGSGIDARDTFRHRLTQVQVAIHNQDNREHDIFDSDDYFQFHGGMIASIRALSGKKPSHYFGDSHDPAHPRVRDLKEEALRVFRTRVVNPKWLEGITRHGYKGGLELAATVDYLFGYDATAQVIDDWMYEQVTRAYVMDSDMQAFLRQLNPWALHAMSERLLEAIERGMWSEPSEEARAALSQQLLEADAFLEAASEWEGEAPAEPGPRASTTFAARLSARQEPRPPEEIGVTPS